MKRNQQGLFISLKSDSGIFQSGILLSIQILELHIEIEQIFERLWKGHPHFQ